MQKNFVRGISRGALDPESKTWPGPVELTLLRLVGIVWSTSDLSHPVAAAAMLLIGQYLSQSRLRTLGDVASGLFLCTLAGQYESFSKRLVPEVANFLLNAFVVLLPTTITTKNFPGSCPSPDLGQDHVKNLRLRSSDPLEPRPLNFVASLAGKSSDKQLKVDLIAANLALFKDLGEKYVSLDAFIELFRPVEVVLAAVSPSHVPASIQVRSFSCVLSFSWLTIISFLPEQNFEPTKRHQTHAQTLRFVPKAAPPPTPQAYSNPHLYSQIRRGIQSQSQIRSRHRTSRSEQTQVSLQEGEEGGDSRATKGQQIPCERESETQGCQGCRVHQKGTILQLAPVFGLCSDASGECLQIAKIMGSLQDERAEEKVHNKAREKGKRQDKARGKK